MGQMQYFFTPLHKKTSRKYIDRMVDEKVHCMLKAKEYETDYWDGDRRYGYGGYKYDGRWKSVAEALIEKYGLTDESKILDVGCGKAHLIFELHQLLPQAEIQGFDISVHGLGDAPKEVRGLLSRGKAQDSYKWEDKYFDLVVSMGCVHNLRIFELEKCLKEIERVGKQKYIMMESYRNEEEQFNLQCWALTAESFFDKEEWEWVFDHFGYSGDYEFIYFE